MVEAHPGELGWVLEFPDKEVLIGLRASAAGEEAELGGSEGHQIRKDILFLHLICVHASGQSNFLIHGSIPKHGLEGTKVLQKAER